MKNAIFCEKTKEVQNANLKKTCKQKGISVTKLEADLGFARSTIYKWDTHQPGIGKLKKVSDYLGVTMEYLLADQKESA